MSKPIGTFQCSVCGDLWDGSELYAEPMLVGCPWTCGDLFCGALVYRVSDEPKLEYLAAKAEKAGTA